MAADLPAVRPGAETQDSLDLNIDLTLPVVASQAQWLGSAFPSRVPWHGAQSPHGLVTQPQPGASRPSQGRRRRRAAACP